MRRRTRKSSIDAVKRGVCTVLVDPESTLNEVNIGDTEKVVKNHRSSTVLLRYRSRPPCPIVTNT